MNNNTILSDFYSALADGKPLPHIPHSSVFYTQQAYYGHSGVWESIDRIERCLYLEGMIDRSQVLDPDRKRDWEE